MSVNPKLRDPDVDRLFQAILTLRSLDEYYRLFEDLCTINEIKSLASRLKAAFMLSEGKTYDEIEHSTGMSTATISRVKRFLHYGADGYKLVIERMGKTVPPEV
jgi:TrpR-related protein YerC/YecD